MKILSLHCDYIKFKPLKKALNQPEELSEERKKEITVKDPLVILTAVEKQDEQNTNIIKEYVENIISLASQVNATHIVLYPYAHLSPSLSKPDFALKTLEQAEKELSKDKTIKVTRAPFGYYKEFELKCKGHPLSELSRSIGENVNSKEDASKKSLISKDEVIDYKQLLREISKSKLDTRELKENDHRIIGKQMDLFSFNEVAPGMVFWHNNGLIIRNKLIEFWREEHRKADYEEILTPQILDKRLWQISGHWEKYKENIFLTEYEKKTFAVKPMNCPGGMLIYKTNPKSYKDLPIRAAELGIVHRQELSGVLGGLFRVIQFTQDDAHIYCTEKQLEQEIINIIDLNTRIYKKLNIEFDHVELSTRPEKRIGEEKLWDKAEKVLEDVLKKKKMNFKINKGDGAFYGPKIDFHIKDSLGRTWQTATIQLDFAMPERFDLTYNDENNQQKRPVMLHRTVLGSLERFTGILLEHTNGHLPLWLAPKQIRIINFTDKNNKSCEKLEKELNELGFRVDTDIKSEPIGGKIKAAEILKINVIIVIGNKEEMEGTLAVRRNGKIVNMKKEEFIKKLTEEINNKN
ncbi:threonine--tRNA ligase [Candidatus Pacearchaeota archaeon]|nr:threonine--tRNA ligase [Candidatus Pacearchaeota archaeon]